MIGQNLPFDLPALPHDAVGLVAWFGLIVLGMYWLASQRQNKIDKSQQEILAALVRIEAKAGESSADLKTEIIELRRDIDEMRDHPRRFHRPRR